MMTSLHCGIHLTRAAFLLCSAAVFFSASSRGNPTIGLVNCPADYAPASSSCTCKAENVTESFRRLLWKDPSGKTIVFGQESQTSVELPFTRIEPQLNEQNYTCQLVDNSHPSSIKYNPKVAAPPSTPFLKDCPTDYILPADDTANCTCTTTNLGVPAALIVWEDPEQNIVTHAASGTALSLSFTDITANLSGRDYQCILRHVTGDLTVSYQPLLVVSPHSPEIEGLKAWYAPAESVRLKCTVKGGVPGTQKISFNCTNHPDRPDEIEDSHLTSSLVFQARAIDNNTQCTCFGTNDYFFSSVFSFNLSIGNSTGSDLRPNINLPNCPEYFLVGSSSCSCVAEHVGNSSVTLLWKDPEGKTIMYGNTSKLTLTMPQSEFNKQQFQCILLHSSGTQSISYTLNVAVPPSPPRVTNCPKDKAEAEKESAQCTCLTLSLGEPPALFVWEDPQGNPVYYTQTETSLVLPFTAVNESFFQQPYRCILRHITGDLSVEYISLKGGPPDVQLAKSAKPSASLFGASCMILVTWLLS